MQRFLLLLFIAHLLGLGSLPGAHPVVIRAAAQATAHAAVQDPVQPPVVFERHPSPTEPQSVRYHCQPESWREPARMENGVYIAQLQMDCFVAVEAGSSVKGIRAEMEDTLRATRVVHQGPLYESHSGLPASKYQVTVALKDEGEGIQVDEDVWIASDEKTQLIYETSSRSIRAQGMASYLRKVWFRAEVKASSSQSGYQVRLLNRIEVARPWYAMEWVFTPIAKKSVIQKFHKVRDELLPKIAGSLAQN
jgi:hypothetical protein